MLREPARSHDRPFPNNSRVSSDYICHQHSCVFHCFIAIRKKSPFGGVKTSRGHVERGKRSLFLRSHFTPSIIDGLPRLIVPGWAGGGRAGRRHVAPVSSAALRLKTGVRGGRREVSSQLWVRPPSGISPVIDWTLLMRRDRLNDRRCRELRPLGRLKPCF